MATWHSISGASGYLLDVSTTESFNDYVEGYHDLRIGDATGRAVTGLNPGTTYYYRVRPYYVTGVGSYSEAMSQTDGRDERTHNPGDFRFFDSR